MGQSISDAFYPDNPNRRNRAEQLKHDIEAFAKTYEEIKATRERLLAEIKPQLTELLKNEGYDTPEKLDQKVRSVLRGEHLEKYLEVKASYDKRSELERTVFSISSYISIGAGVFLGTIALLGIITGGTAFAAMGVVAGALAIVAIVLVIMAAVEGAKERSNLQDAIRKLGPERVKARRALMMMQAISNWLVYIKTYLNSAIVKKNPEMKAEIWEGDFKADFEKSSHAAVVKWLQDFDRQRGAWTNEDGDWKRDPDPPKAKSLNAVSFISLPHSVGNAINVVESGLESITSPLIHGPGVHTQSPDLENAMVVLKHATEQTSMQLIILDCAPDMCIGMDNKGEKWALMPETITPTADKGLDIKTCIFSIEKLADGSIIHDMAVVELTPIF